MDGLTVIGLGIPLTAGIIGTCSLISQGMKHRANGHYVKTDVCNVKHEALERELSGINRKLDILLDNKIAGKN